MKPLAVFLTLALLVMPVSLIAEEPTESSNQPAAEAIPGDGWGVTVSHPNRPEAVLHPFTLGATMESVGTLGGQFQIATNLNRRVNLRTNYNFFLWKKWESYRGFGTHATLDMLSTNASIDFYPFPNHGLRLSPGLLIHNQQVGEGIVPLAPDQGGPFTVNGHTYYSAPATLVSPLGPDDSGSAKTKVAVNVPAMAFTMTTGWGNMIPRRRVGPWSFPVELGVAFLGSPTVKTTWFLGQVCNAQGQNCTPVRLDPQLRSDLQAHFGPYRSHLDLLKTYPIVSFGVAYSFDFRTKAPY